MIYDPFQQEAIDHITEGSSVIVSAPTGAGKTAIAEYVINDALLKAQKVIYTAPIKALSNQKFRDFQCNFTNKIGILTGDVSINPHAPILIMTTEIFRNKLLEENQSLADYGWIIFDEIHYLDDYERGTVWEESLIFLPQHMKILALSATIPNLNEFSEWIHSIHKIPVKIVKEDKRPVPLHFSFHCNNQIFNNINQLKKIIPRSPLPYGERGRARGREKTTPNRLDTLIKHLHESNKLPCIYFAFGRRRCEYLAEELLHFDFLNYPEKTEIKKLYKTLCEKFELLNEKSAVSMLPLIERGIAFHHAGMLPTLKEVIERLFTSRLIKVIFTTETFSLGINMPAKTVVFDELRKFYGNFHSNLRTRDFFQMAGRAGRRGIDEEGFVYSRINPHYISFEEVYSTIYGHPEKVQSRFNASYATILNLYQKYKETLYEIYPYSFHYFQAGKHSRKKALEVLYNKVKILKELGYIKNNLLTPKGEFAARVYGYELPLTELYSNGILENLSEIELGILSAALVFEPRKHSIMPSLNKTARSLTGPAQHIVQNIQRLEKKLGIKPLSKAYAFHLSPCIEAWLNKESFENILKHTNADEGEVIRYFRMALQILKEILDTNCSTSLKAKIKNLTSTINRDIIDAEKHLCS